MRKAIQFTPVEVIQILMNHAVKEGIIPPGSFSDVNFTMDRDNAVISFEQPPGSNGSPSPVP